LRPLKRALRRPETADVTEWAYANVDHFLALALLLARGGDILSTWLVTPRLELEANGLARRLGWKFAVITLPVCLLPYYHTGLGFSAVVVFLLVAAGNLKGVWLVRTIGERRYLRLVERAARAGRGLDFAVATGGHALMFAAFGALLLLFHESGSWGFYAALGVFGYAFAAFFHTCLFYRRVRNAPEPAAG